MRNAWRLIVFDVVAPLAAIAALLVVGVMLGWPQWWVALCPVLVLLIVEGVLINFWLLRRDLVTLGTDDDRPGLRLAVVGLCTAALVTVVAVGFTHWTKPDRAVQHDSAEVVKIATAMAEATATFNPQNPAASRDRAAAMMVPDQADAFKDQFAKATADLAHRDITAQATTLEAGVEAIGPSLASVVVLLRSTRTSPGQPPSRTVLALRVALTKPGDRWLVAGVAPINSR
jgi:hypothetical protein